jgi:hypothetical protein
LNTLLALGSPPSIKLSTPLYQACKEENLEQIKQLIVSGADLWSSIKVSASRCGIIH